MLQGFSQLPISGREEDELENALRMEMEGTGRALPTADETIRKTIASIHKKRVANKRHIDALETMKREYGNTSEIDLHESMWTEREELEEGMNYMQYLMNLVQTKERRIVSN